MRGIFRVRGAVGLRVVLVAVLAGCGPVGIAQKAMPVAELRPLQAGVTVPVRISRYLTAGGVKAGTKFVATTTQRVPVGETLYLDRGAKVQGEVVTSVKGDGTAAQPSVLSLRFTALEYKKQTVPLTANVIAIANFVQVDDTTFPTNGSTDRGNSNPASWTTRQIGGDLVLRSGWVGGVFGANLKKVGEADFFGVYSLPGEGPAGGPGFSRALGVFSTTAAGLYGIEDDTKMQSAGGTTTLTRTAKKLVLRNGDQLLLEVVGPGGGGGLAER